MADIRFILSLWTFSTHPLGRNAKSTIACAGYSETTVQSATPIDREHATRLGVEIAGGRTRTGTGLLRHIRTRNETLFVVAMSVGNSSPVPCEGESRPEEGI